MNAPLPEHIRKALETVSLDDKYALHEGRAFMSGVQALVRLPMLQRTRDALAGKKVEPRIDTGVAIITKENMGSPENAELLAPPR